LLGLAFAVVGIALPDSLNPSLILGAVYLALQPRAFRRTLAFTITAFAVTLAGGLLIALGLGDLILALLPKLSRTSKSYLLTLLGVALVGGGVAIWCKRHSLADDDSAASWRHRAPPGSAVLMGAGIAGVELLTAFPYFAAIAMVTGSSESTAAKVFLIVLYNVIYVLPLVAVVLACTLMGKGGRAKLSSIGDWIALHWPVVVAPLVGAVGVALAAYGIVQIA